LNTQVPPWRRLDRIVLLSAVSLRPSSCTIILIVKGKKNLMVANSVVWFKFNRIGSVAITLAGAALAVAGTSSTNQQVTFSNDIDFALGTSY